MVKNIAILSGKGGTGKTTVAINLAVALHSLGENTLLVDANFENPHIGVSLGSGFHLHTIHDVLADRIAPTQAVHYHESGLKVVPGNIRFKNDTLKLERLGRYKTMAETIIYDCPSNNHSHVWHGADQAIIVTQAQFPALADAARILNELETRNKVLVGVVLNNRAKNDISTAKVEDYLGVPVVAEIPRDEHINAALSTRTPYYLAHKNRPAAKAIRELATRISNRV